MIGMTVCRSAGFFLEGPYRLSRFGPDLAVDRAGIEAKYDQFLLKFCLFGARQHTVAGGPAGNEFALPLQTLRE